MKRKAADMNLGKVQFKLRDVSGKMIRDKVKITLVNQTLRSRDRQVEMQFQGRARTLSVPAHPNGHYQIFISPGKYRSKSVFVGVGSNNPARVEETLFVNPDRISPTFPSYSDLSSQEQWSELFPILLSSDISAQDYDALSDLEKGGLFNLYAKMRFQAVAEGRSVFSFVGRVAKVKQDRIFVNVREDLLSRVRRFEEGFHAAAGTLHSFGPGWERVASFKTFEKTGNLQLTFARSPTGKFLVDADVDDHQGIQHAFDVLEHKISGEETHPFDIHQILLFFQHIDPGYVLT